MYQPPKTIFAFQQTPYLGNAAVLYWFRITGPRYRVAVWNPKINLKFKSSLLFLPSYCNTSANRRRKRISRGREETNGIRYQNRKPTTTNQTKQITPTNSPRPITSPDVLFNLRLLSSFMRPFDISFRCQSTPKVDFSVSFFLSLMMRWSVYSESPVTLVPLLHVFCSSGNSQRLISE